MKNKARQSEDKDGKVRQNKHIRKGDKVYVMAGNDSGLVGEVMSRTDDRVTIRGVNIRSKHVKKSQANPSGGIVKMEKPIHISNVRICVEEGKPVKIKTRVNDNDERELYYKDSGRDVSYRTIKKH